VTARQTKTFEKFLRVCDQPGCDNEFWAVWARKTTCKTCYQRLRRKGLIETRQYDRSRFSRVDHYVVLRARGMTQQMIADTCGVSRQAVQQALADAQRRAKMEKSNG
jgi:predicted transcriptional regulator